MSSNVPPALLALDESTASHYVTCGGVYVHSSNLDAVTEAIKNAKADYNIPADEEIHCRILFAGDKRIKTGFRDLDPGQIIPFLSHCVQLTSRAGCRWFGVHCDSRDYPTNMIVRSPSDGGNFFPTTVKHIASLLFPICVMRVDQLQGPDYKVIYDRDPTKLHWGISNRMQATHFVRTLEKAVEAGAENSHLLELADMAAYVLAKILHAQLEPENNKLQRFGFTFALMNMQTVTFGWPESVRREPYF